MSNYVQTRHAISTMADNLFLVQRVPFAVLNDTTPWGQHLLQDAHARLIGWHTERGLQLPMGAEDSLPTEAIVAMYVPMAHAATCSPSVAKCMVNA